MRSAKKVNPVFSVVSFFEKSNFYPWKCANQNANSRTILIPVTYVYLIFKL
ncbi:hypothetical protein PMI33_05470 [Pseudomonas sp. GM67]|nr:hypothetical protein PMI33_05470 [Pseudomonas sp. GM67]